MTVDTLGNISKKMDKHNKDDKVLNEKDVQNLENKLNRHMTIGVKIIKPGKNFMPHSWKQYMQYVQERGGEPLSLKKTR